MLSDVLYFLQALMSWSLFFLKCIRVRTITRTKTYITKKHFCTKCLAVMDMPMKGKMCPWRRPPFFEQSSKGEWPRCEQICTRSFCFFPQPEVELWKCFPHAFWKGIWMTQSGCKCIVKQYSELPQTMTQGPTSHITFAVLPIAHVYLHLHIKQARLHIWIN